MCTKFLVQTMKAPESAMESVSILHGRNTNEVRATKTWPITGQQPSALRSQRSAMLWALRKIKKLINSSAERRQHFRRAPQARGSDGECIVKLERRARPAMFVPLPAPDVLTKTAHLTPRVRKSERQLLSFSPSPLPK